MCAGLVAYNGEKEVGTASYESLTVGDDLWEEHVFR